MSSGVSLVRADSVESFFKWLTMRVMHSLRGTDGYRAVAS